MTERTTIKKFLDTEVPEVRLFAEQYKIDPVKALTVLAYEAFLEREKPAVEGKWYFVPANAPEAIIEQGEQLERFVECFKDYGTSFFESKKD